MLVSPSFGFRVTVSSPAPCQAGNCVGCGESPVCVCVCVCETICEDVM